MIDWPNLIAGAVLGFLLALIPWMIDRRRAKQQRELDAATAWMSAAKEIELAARPEATSADIYRVRVKYPVDLWRSILGPHDFQALERLEGAYSQVEGMVTLVEQNHTPQNTQRLEAELVERRDAYVSFANLSRRMQDVSYSDVVRKEENQRIRRDYLAHPLRTWKRERKSRRTHSRKLHTTGAKS